jgi:hypothetical protein
MRDARRDRGSALAMVILVILVLTIVGIAIAYFTQIEDRLSGNVRIQKASLYAADSGLRQGEAVLGAMANASISLSAVLNYTGAQPPLSLPGSPTPPWGGAWNAVLLDTTALTGIPANFQAAFLNQAVTGVPAGAPDQISYSLYVRNNLEDITGTAISDGDNIINLIAIGQVQVGSATFTKIIEEQVLVVSGGVKAGSQKDVNEGGTNATALK